MKAQKSITSTISSAEVKFVTIAPNPKKSRFRTVPEARAVMSMAPDHVVQFQHEGPSAGRAADQLASEWPSLLG